MKLEDIIKTIATLLAIIGSSIGFYIFTKDIALSVMFMGIVISLSLHLVTFDKLAEIRNEMATKEEIQDLREEFAREINDIKQKMATKEDLLSLRKELVSKMEMLSNVVFNINKMFIDFLAVRKIISSDNAKFLKSSLKTMKQSWPKL